MFFFLSKTINVFTMPLVIIVMLLLASIVVKSVRWKYWLSRIGLGLLIFCCNEFVSNEIMRAWEAPVVPFAEVKKEYAFGILLCGVAKSNMEVKDRVYFSRGADRVIHTFQLYKAGIIKKILISGGSGSLIDRGHREADELASVLIMFGVPAEDIITDNKSQNTHDSAIEVKLLLEGKAQPSECVLITSAFHMRRSLACFSKVGWTMDVFPTDFLSHNRKFTLDSILIPSLDSLVLWHVLTKEWAGFVAYRIAGYL